jgi:hypothetical protein
MFFVTVNAPPILFCNNILNRRVLTVQNRLADEKLWRRHICHCICHKFREAAAEEGGGGDGWPIH